MAVDKDLFVYDLAVVAIMKNEAPYVKEWLDYHLAAGVDHFYIYDNESPDNLKEVLQPYIDAGIVNYSFCPGLRKQIEVYNEAFKSYRFFCRYMAFIDADEFIFPQSNESITEVTDKIFSQESNIGGLGIHWMSYGSNDLETADYSKGVLERFTRRAYRPVGDTIKTIANPRKIKFITTPHRVRLFVGSISIYDDFSKDQYDVSKKILCNHYRLKSREEYLAKTKNSSVDAVYGDKDYYNPDKFNHEEDNAVFDDSILTYRDSRIKMQNPTGKQIDYEKLINALIKNISTMFGDNVPLKNFEGKMETFLTCRALASFLKCNVLDNARGEFIEKLSLQAIYYTLLTDLSSEDAELFLSELPNLLPLNYPVVKDIYKISLEIIPQLKSQIQSSITDHTKFEHWQDFNEYDNLLRILKVFENYELK